MLAFAEHLHLDGFEPSYAIAKSSPMMRGFLQQDAGLWDLRLRQFVSSGQNGALYLSSKADPQTAHAQF